MRLPAHTQIVLALYLHAVVVVSLLHDLGGATLPFHPLATGFIYFLVADGGLIPVAHGLWLAWTGTLGAVDPPPALALVLPPAAVVAVVATARLVRRKTIGPAAIIAVAVVAVVAMGVPAAAARATLPELHARTATFYLVAWMLEAFVRQTSMFGPDELRALALPFVFAVLAVPLPVAAVGGVATAVFIARHVDDFIEQGTAHSPQP